MTTLNPAAVSRAHHGQEHRTQRAGSASGWLQSWGRLAVFYLGCLLAAWSYGLTLLLPSLAKAAGGSPAQAGLIYWCGAFGAAGALVLTGRLTERIGGGWSAAAGSVLYAVAAAALASDGARSGIAYGAGVLLGAGWALFFTCAPIIAAAIPGPARASSRFLVLAGFNAAGIGVAPVAGQLLAAHGTSYRGIFWLAAVASLASGALFGLVAKITRPPATASRPARAARAVIGPVRLVLTSSVRRFLLMVGLGACVFTTMTTYQATLATTRGLNPAVFYASYTLGVIIPRFTVTSALARFSPATATSTLLAGMCLALTGFLLTGHQVTLYAASSVLLGVTYGLAYPLIQAQAAGTASAGLRHWALWYFSGAYFAGLYGFPLIASTIIDLGGYQALIAALLVVAVLELVVSLKTQRAQTSKGCNDRARPGDKVPVAGQGGTCSDRAGGRNA
jgi:MFS family permease